MTERDFGYAPWGMFRDEAGGEAGGEGGEAGGAPNTVIPGDGGGGGEDPPKLPDGAFMAAQWREALPEDLRGAEGLGKVDSLEAMARSYLSAQKLVGKDPASTIELPKSDADFKEHVGILRRLGSPEKPEGFKLEAPKDTPEPVAAAINLDSPLGKAFLQTASEVGLLPQQAQAVYGTFAKHMAEAMEAQTGVTDKSHEDNIETLKNEAGQAFDEWVRAAEFAIEKLGGNDLRDAINGAGLGTNPAVVKALVKAGKMMAEDTSDAGGGGTGFNTLAPAEAEARGKDLLRKALNEKDAAEKKRLNAEAQRFFEMAHGKKTVGIG